jgi:uncharacterized YigZ family protein
MDNNYKIIKQSAEAVLIERKSKFIGYAAPVSTEEEAQQFLNGIRKKHYDASHNCYAYILGEGSSTQRSSDDGEPSKTAGKPMLDILISHELYNLVVVVTRYFGGTLLGTGGLVKAYQGAVLEGLKSSRMITKELGNRITLTTDYNLIGKIQYLISQENITLLNSEYTDIVTLSLLVQPCKMAFITKKIAELTNGSAILEFSGQVYFTNSDGEVILF